MIETRYTYIQVGGDTGRYLLLIMKAHFGSSKRRLIVVRILLVYSIIICIKLYTSTKYHTETGLHKVKLNKLSTSQ